MTKAQERAREYYPDSDDKAIIHTISMRAWHERGQEAFTAGYAQGQRDLVEAGVSVWVCPEWREVKPAILASPNQIMEGDVEVLIIERKLVGVEDDNKA